VPSGKPTLRIRLRSEPTEPHSVDFSAMGRFRIGRDPACQVQLASPLVSRMHAEVRLHAGSWHVEDLGSTNGLILNGTPLEAGELRDGDRLQLGKGAPVLLVSLEEGGAVEEPVNREYPIEPDGVEIEDAQDRTVEPTEPRESAGHGPASDPGPSPPQPETDRAYSLTEIEERYLNPQSDQPAGQRTQFIRMAFAQVQKRERKKTRLILGVVGLLLLASAAYGVFQRQRVRELDRQAAEFFRLMKSYEVQLVALRQEAERTGSPGLMGQLDAIESARREARESYDAFVRERGIYRRLRTDEERLIYETARLFGESEIEISNSFIEAVLNEIQGYWLSPVGQARFLGALERAERNGYTGRIVDVLRSRGVPPEFFYLALQESEFSVTAVGPETRWGRAKGMWQFIPSTAERYGLNPGSRTGTEEADPNDERLDFDLSTDAAARYLRDLHGILTQASGLLVMAAYNWGEHRILPRLENLPEPRDVFREEFSGVPMDPASRNYWRFLVEYEDRMPPQTKEYVLRIFAAAVIGRDPGHFGLEINNPLAPYLD